MYQIFFQMQKKKGGENVYIKIIVKNLIYICIQLPWQLLDVCMWVRNATCMRCDIQSQTRDMSLLTKNNKQQHNINKFLSIDSPNSQATRIKRQKKKS